MSKVLIALKYESETKIFTSFSTIFMPSKAHNEDKTLISDDFELCLPWRAVPGFIWTKFLPIQWSKALLPSSGQ